MSDPELQQIEEKIAYLEIANAQMEDEMFRQQREIETLTRAHRGLLKKLERTQDGEKGNRDELAERPPHY